MVKRLVVVTGVVLSLAWAGAHLIAQQTTAPRSAPAGQTKAATATAPDLSRMPLINVTMVQIKPELLTEWQDFQKNEVIPTLQKAGVKSRTGIATVIGPSFQYTFLTPVTNFAERDGDSPIVKALGQDGARTFGQKNRRFIESQRTFVVRARTDLSYQPDPSAPPLPIAVVSEYTLTPGHLADFESYIKNDVTPAHKQVKTGGFLVYQGLFGGEGNTVVVANLMRNFAELDNGPAVTRAYGAARAAAIQQKIAGFITHVERTVSRRAPELSFQPRLTSENR